MRYRIFELARYCINGVVATIVHYLVLFTCMELMHFDFAALANIVASAFGIATSFLGNRYFVFRSTGEKILTQASRFIGLYAVIALINGFVLYVWSDCLNLNYNYGFMIAVVIQFSLSYLGGKKLVFHERMSLADQMKIKS